MSNLSDLRKYAAGEMDEAALQAGLVEDVDISEYENDAAFMESVEMMCMPTMLQMMILGESCENLDEDVAEAFQKVQNYLIGQGAISEAAAVHINNPKINVVHLNKQAQINRLSTIITLKMARNANHKSYRKYKIGQKIRKDNMAEMKKLYGPKADRLAKKLWARTAKNNKVAAVTEKAKK